MIEEEHRLSVVGTVGLVAEAGGGRKGRAERKPVGDYHPMDGGGRALRLLGQTNSMTGVMKKR